MNGAMVRATLDGSKTQTRRLIKPWEPRLSSKAIPEDVSYLPDFTCYRATCPYGQPGDRLYVRETHALIWPGESEPEHIEDNRVEYRADTDGSSLPGHWPPDHSDDPERPRWRPSIHMPRWASRISLEIVSVRVERLQDISEADAAAEGVNPIRDKVPTSKDAFRYLWGDINGADSWKLNPWVWVVEFKRVA